MRRVVAIEAAPVGSRDWPASIAAVAHLLEHGLELPSGVTLLVGENGSGKSTLVEAVAMAFGLAAEGGTRNVQAGTRSTESPLHRWIRLERAPGASRWASFYARSRCTATSPVWSLSAPSATPDSTR